MSPKTAQLLTAVLALVLPLILLDSSWCQGETLSCKVTSPTGAPVASAKVVVRNLATNQSTDTLSTADGTFSVPNLTSGDYEISITAQGFSPKVVKTTVTSTPAPALEISLTEQASTLPEAPSSNLPNAPSSTQPSLSDLGFPEAQTQGSLEEQARLDKRSHMLKTHQKLGLITTAPLIATVVTGFGAGGKNPSNTDRTVHAVLGSTTAGLYIATASFAIFAPKIQGTPTRGPIRVHKALAWIHGPGMILTPILGAMAFNEKSKGEKVHGIASAHGAVAIITAGAYGAALLSVSLKF